MVQCMQIFASTEFQQTSQPRQATASRRRDIIERWVDALRSLNAAMPGTFTARRALTELQELEEEWDRIAG
jgi:hypothetical protein